VAGQTGFSKPFSFGIENLMHATIRKLNTLRMMPKKLLAPPIIKKSIYTSISVIMAICLAGCVLPITHLKSKPTVKGYITGIVLDSKSRPVSGVKIEGIWLQRWTVFFPPPGFEIVDGNTTSDANGKFALNASQKLDLLYAETADRKLNGQSAVVTQRGNVIHLSPFQLDRMNVH
jgi:hypothetical protein